MRKNFPWASADCSVPLFITVVGFFAEAVKISKFLT